jgi:hypothetical protein
VCSPGWWQVLLKKTTLQNTKAEMLHVSEAFATTNGRAWFVGYGELPTWAIIGSMVFPPARCPVSWAHSSPLGVTKR